MSYIYLDDRPSAYFDCDDTLLMWKPVEGQPAVRIVGPTGKVFYSTPHQSHIDQLVEHSRRGHRIVCWSAGGAEWCKAVVEALGLTPYVDLVCAKPTWIYDDKPASDWLGDDKRSFLDLVTGKRIV